MELLLEVYIFTIYLISSILNWNFELEIRKYYYDCNWNDIWNFRWNYWCKQKIED